MEAIGQDVEQESAHKLAGCQTHHFRSGTAVLAIILPAEADMRFIDRDQSAIADGNPMGVASEIGKHLLWACKRTLRIDDPLAVAQRRQMGSERSGVFQLSEIIEELQLTRDMQGFQALKEESPEQARENAHRQEKVMATRHPAVASRGDAATGNDAMHVR